MRHLGDSTAGQSASRPRDQAARETSGRRGQPVAAPGSEQSVFVPGYRGRRPEPAHRAAGGDAPGANAPGAAWSGSSDGAAGKGPVRGFPPAPGHPQPLYPPGQFAAWNRGTATAGDPQEDAWSRLAAADAGWAADSRDDRDLPWSGTDSPSGGRDYEPGYSALAVSDPSADVTSTQTWQAIEDGPVAGAWTDPHETAVRSPAVQSPAGQPPAGQPPAGQPPAGQPPAGDRAVAAANDPGWPAAPGNARRARADARTAGPDAAAPGTRARGSRAAGRRGAGSRSARSRDTRALASAAGGATTASSGTAPGSTAAASGGTATGGGAASSPPGVTGATASDATASGPRATGSAATRTPAGSRAAGSRVAGSRAAARNGRSGRKGRSSSTMLAVCAVLVLAVAAGAFLFFTARHQGSATTAPTTPPATTSSTPAPSPSPTLGPNGHIASRAADLAPLTITQLFPHNFTIAGASFVRTISQTGKSCAAVLIGSRLQSAVKAAKCNQVVRATYLSARKKEMGTIGVLNLIGSKAALHAGHAAGATDYIKQLRAAKGATHKLGEGTGIEEAEAKGHYLILIWAQFTSRHKPKTAGQRRELENFMNDLFVKTANVSLTNRLVDGKP